MIANDHGKRTIRLVLYYLHQILGHHLVSLTSLALPLPHVLLSCASSTAFLLN